MSHISISECKRGTFVGIKEMNTHSGKCHDQTCNVVWEYIVGVFFPSLRPVGPPLRLLINNSSFNLISHSDSHCVSHIFNNAVQWIIWLCSPDFFFCPPVFWRGGDGGGGGVRGGGVRCIISQHPYRLKNGYKHSYYTALFRITCLSSGAWTSAPVSPVSHVSPRLTVTYQDDSFKWLNRLLFHGEEKERKIVLYKYLGGESVLREEWKWN